MRDCHQPTRAPAMALSAYLSVSLLASTYFSVSLLASAYLSVSLLAYCSWLFIPDGAGLDSSPAP